MLLARSFPFILLAFILVSCGLARTDYFTKDYELNKKLSATVGSVMMGWETGIKNPVYGNIYSSTRKELSYGGIAQGVIQISYREYRGGYAAPAFYQDLKYDIASTDTITFQDITIEIDKADQTMIVYTILAEPQSVKAIEAAKATSKN